MIEDDPESVEDIPGKLERAPGSDPEISAREPEAPGVEPEGSEGVPVLDPDPTVEVPPATPEDVAETGKEFLDGLLNAMGLEAEVASSIEEGTAFLDVSGEGLGGLIGRRGQTLDALQELARTAVQRKLRARIRLLVDVEGYRARRRASLAEYAREMATRAKERGTEIELEPMSAYERKIVHQAVSEIDGASSFSEGEEPARKVVIRGD